MEGNERDIKKVFSFRQPRKENCMVKRTLEELNLLDDFLFNAVLSYTLFLYTRGTKGNISQELQQFLQYMEHTTLENAGNESLKKIHTMVEKVKNDREVTIEYMKIFEREQMLIKKGQKMEQENTERERSEKEKAQKRAEEEKNRAEEAEKKLKD